MRTKIISVILCLVLTSTVFVVAESDLSSPSEDMVMQLAESTYLGYTNITVEQAYALLTSTSNGVQIPIDVRTNSEWAVAHIDTPSPENPQHWPYLQTGQNLTQFLATYQGKEIVLYCKAGSRSRAAANLLVQNNFTGVIYNMLGGIDAWTQAGYPTKPNTPPNTPSITGDTKGKPGLNYTYTFTTTDPDQDYLFYYINWTDNTTDQLIGPFQSGAPAVFGHIWAEKGTYLVKVKARDRYGAESDYKTLEVKMPYSYTPMWRFFDMVFQRFPHAFPVIRYLLG